MGFQLGKEISIFEEMNDWCDFGPKAHVIECDTQDSSRGFVGCERKSLKLLLNLQHSSKRNEFLPEL